MASQTSVITPIQSAASSRWSPRIPSWPWLISKLAFKGLSILADRNLKNWAQSSSCELYFHLKAGHCLLLLINQRILS